MQKSKHTNQQTQQQTTYPKPQFKVKTHNLQTSNNTQTKHKTNNQNKQTNNIHKP